MVDSLISINEEYVETIFAISNDNLFTRADGTFSEAGLVENAAQTCSAIVAKDYFVDENNEDRDDVDVIGFISGIKSLKIFSVPKSGETITTKARLISKFVTDEYSLCTMECRTFSGSVQLLEGQINLFIQQQSAENVVKSTVSR